MRFFDNAVAVMFLSFIVGMMVNALLHLLGIHDRLSSGFLFSRATTYERLGVLWFRRILLASPLRLFNTHIRFSSNRSLENLETVRKHMSNAEVAHWAGFAAMLVLNVVVWWYRGLTVGLAYLVFNILGNLYPSLLQQYNRHRLMKVMAVAQRKHASD